MAERTWLVTGVSSGFGRELSTPLLDRDDQVLGTVRHPDAVADLADRHPDTFRAELLDVTDGKAVRDLVDRGFADLGRVDVVVSNAGYGLFGAAEELSDTQVDHIIATNLTGSIQLIRAALPHLRPRAAAGSSSRPRTAGRSRSPATPYSRPQRRRRSRYWRSGCSRRRRVRLRVLRGRRPRR